MSKILQAISQNKIALTAYWTTMVFSIAIFTAGFFMPPMGEISGSVLIAAGSAMLFTLAVIALICKQSVSVSVDADDRKVTFTTKKSDDEKGGE